MPMSYMKQTSFSQLEEEENETLRPIKSKWKKKKNQHRLILPSTLDPK